MATQTVEIKSIGGETGLTLKVYAKGSDTQADSQSATEATNRTGVYTAAFTDLAEGTYYAELLDGSGVKLADGEVATEAATGTYYVYEQASSGSSGGDITSISGSAPAADRLEAILLASGSSDTAIASNIVATEVSASTLGEGIAGTTWTFTNATTVEQSFTLGNITGWKKLWCGVKRSKGNEDADALILIEESNPDDSINDGLQYINGAESETKGNGSLTVSDESAGTVAFALEAVEAKKLPTIEGVFEFKWMDANDKVHILSTRGVCNIQRAYVQDVS